MKVIAFNGSPRKDGNTTILINKVFNELEQEGMETEMVQLSAKEIHGCIACYKCMENKDQRCAVKDDAANEYIEKMTGAQGIILGSPVYFMDVTPEMKALIDRTGFVSRANGGMYRNKVGAAVVALRRAGGMHAIDAGQRHRARQLEGMQLLHIVLQGTLGTNWSSALKIVA